MNGSIENRLGSRVAILRILPIILDFNIADFLLRDEARGASHYLVGNLNSLYSEHLSRMLKTLTLRERKRAHANCSALSLSLSFPSTPRSPINRTVSVHPLQREVNKSMTDGFVSAGKTEEKTAAMYGVLDRVDRFDGGPCTGMIETDRGEAPVSLRAREGCSAKTKEETEK